ncbi:PqqD family protein [Paenibacillus sp. GCM10023252]|uniref:PqqD family protein n=1 Tax=Paenibacillus sp. GCM10023252 TaxID=3252649 RepID=UPI00361FA80B
MKTLENQKLRQHPYVEAAEMEGEWVLLHMETHSVTKINGVGGVIWSLIPEYPTVDQLVTRIQLDYEVEKSQLEADVSSFIENLVDCELLELQDE